MVSPTLSFLTGSFFLQCFRGYIYTDRNAILPSCSFTSCFIHTVAQADSYHMLGSQSTQGLDLVISLKNDPEYFLLVSHLRVTRVHVLCWELPSCLGTGSWTSQGRSPPPQSFLGRSYNLPRAPLSWRSCQKCFSLETTAKEKNKEGIFKTLYSWTIKEPHHKKNTCICLSVRVYASHSDSAGSIPL